MSGLGLLVQCAVFESAHHDLYRNALLWDRELVRERPNHQAGYIERRRYLFAPARLILIQVIYHADANGERAVLFHDIRVKAREIGTGRTFGKLHWSTPVKGLRAHESEWRDFDLLLKLLHGCLPSQIAASATKARTGV